VVLAAWESLVAEGYVGRAIWQSTTGTAPFLIVNGPVRERLGLNSTGNVFGSGFRANVTIGRAIRLGAINAFGLRRTSSTRPPRALPPSTPRASRRTRNRARGRPCTPRPAWIRRTAR
jgi:hypothetical protein